jgi:hypothetical protein
VKFPKGKIPTLLFLNKIFMGNPIPNILPTDNLYKFIAIAGLIIVTISVFKPELLFKRDSDQETLESIEDKIQEGMNSTHKMLNDLSTSGLDSIAKRNEENRLKNINEAFQGHLLQLRDEQKEAARLDGEYLKMTKSMFAIGLGLIFFGFYLWFSNNQVYQDLILKKESGYEITDWKKEHFKIKLRVGLLGVCLVVCFFALFVFEVPPWIVGVVCVVATFPYNRYFN